MAIKEIPINFRVYYKQMKIAYTKLKEEAIAIKENIENNLDELRSSICKNANVYKEEFGVDLFKYDEFKEGKYIDGSFLKVAKGLFINRKNNYTLVSDLFDLYTYARKEKELYDINDDLSLYNKLLSLNVKQYNEILKTFYTEVHTKMIMEGCGYAFEGHLGWICINRCHIERSAPHIDYAATKKRKAELQAQGKRIYKKEEAEWCKQNGIEYNAVDGRVYLNNEYCYEIPLIDCKLPNGTKQKLIITDYRARELRGKTNEDLIKECNSDLNKICHLSIDVKSKLTLCNKVDKTLYLNFIRNENQKPVNAPKADRKDR